MRGMNRSLTMIVGWNEATSARAASPSAAASTVKPQVRTSSVRPRRAASSSSTISTRSAAARLRDVSVTPILYHRIMSLTAPGTPEEAPVEAPLPVSQAVPERLGRPRAFAEVLLCSGYVTQLAVAGVLGLLGFAPTAPAGGLSPTFVFLLSFLDALLLVTIIVWLLTLSGERPVDVLLGPKPWRPDLIVGVAIAPVMLVGIGLLLAALQALVPSLHNVTENPLGNMLKTPLQVAIFAAVVLLAGAVREELQRAFLMHRFRQHLGGPAVGLVVTSIAFGLGHSIQGWDATIATGLMGAIWGAMYLRRRSAVAPMTSHALFNLAELARGVMVGGL